MCLISLILGFTYLTPFKSSIMTQLLSIGPWQILLIVLGIIPTLIAIIDIVKHQFKGNYKIIWLLVVIFTGLFGALMYFLLGKDSKIT